jgi:hypothetical protein
MVLGPSGGWRSAKTALAHAPAIAIAIAITLILVGGLLAGCSSGPAPDPSANPPASIAPSPDYPSICAPVGVDSSSTCLRLTLEAVDRARSAEGLGPMRLPADFPQLSVPEQLFVAIDRERVDRGLAPFTGLSDTLDRSAQTAADARNLPARPASGAVADAAEWIGDVDNGLDAVYEWMYDDGPRSGTPSCSARRTSGCWADRHIVLDHLGTGNLVMGVGFAPSSTGTRGRSDSGSSLAATLAVEPRGQAPLAYTWTEAETAAAAGTLPPLSGVPPDDALTGIPDPRSNVAPTPNYTRSCASSGIDDSPACVTAALDAINHAHALERVKAMVLPAGFAQMSIPEQLFVVVDLERVDRGLSPFLGLTTALDRNAQRGASDAGDPPDAGRHYALDDSEWAGGSVNGLDADYGWMYNDGYNSGNLDCGHRGDTGCWGHRKGILDDFGNGPGLVMGAAISRASDTHSGDVGGTSMAVTLAVAAAPPPSYIFTWAQVAAALPPATF